VALFRGRQRRPSPEPLPAPALARVLGLVERVAAVEEPEEVLAAAVDAAIDLTEAERGWILVRRADGGLEAAAARRRGGEDLEEPLARISRTVVERALAEDRPLCVDEAQEDVQLAAAASVAEMRLRAVLCVPFRMAADSRGVFYLDNRFAAGVFGEQALRMLSAFAGPVAMLLRHSELERRLEETSRALRRANAELARLLRDRTAEVARLETLTAGTGSDREDPFPEILGRSPALRRALAQLARAAAGDYPVLLRGASGTGKDLAARALHRASGRHAEPFVPVALHGLQPALLEAELFGVLRGAYTGADADRPGLVEQAGAGTLFLDGLESLPVELQARLLRLLEDGSYRPVGGGKERRCRARLIAAAREDLALAVREGRFREDLFYRVRVVEVVLPPLRERSGDLRLLFRHFLELAAARLGTAPPEVPAEAWRRLEGWSWPGNVRELANVAERWVALGREAALADLDGAAAAPTLRELEEQHLRRVLREVGGNKAEAARRLGISRRTLYNRLRRLEGQPEPGPGV